jgi:hypothetical protein
MAAASDITARRFSRSGVIGSGMVASNEALGSTALLVDGFSKRQHGFFIGVVAHGSGMDKARSGRDRSCGSFLRATGRGPVSFR